jgi:tRNA threonylcarbamoyl adenosine modification protein (Sua5/YciO/YrdC/YwlC family)
VTAPGVLDLRGTLPDADTWAPVVEHLNRDGAAALPTETVYGFSGRCTPGAVGRVLALKRREADRPLLVLVRGREDAEELVWTPAAEELAQVFWPGALTLVLEDPRRIFPDGVRSFAGKVAVRLSPHPLVAGLLSLLDGPLTSTSANLPGEPPARSGEEARAVVAALGVEEEVMVVEAGLLPPSGPSTIVDCTGPVPVLIREGSLPLNRLRCAVPVIHDR